MRCSSAKYARDQGCSRSEAFALHGAAQLGGPEVVADRLPGLASVEEFELVDALSGHVAAMVGSDTRLLEAAAGRFAPLGADLLAAETHVQAALANQRSAARRTVAGIARLAVSLSNQDIADRQVISVRTVGNYLNLSYPTLDLTARPGFGTRRELDWSES